MRLFHVISLITMICPNACYAQANNWLLTIQDMTQGTPIQQVNGTSGGTAQLYATILNFTGTASSDDGTGNPAIATTLDFAGFGFTLSPGETDLGSLFNPDPQDPGYPSVAGSQDGITPGSSGTVSLGWFDVASLAPGTYSEDFSASAYADDINSTIPFADVTGTMNLVVSPPSVPEASPILSCALLVACWAVIILNKRRSVGKQPVSTLS